MTWAEPPRTRLHQQVWADLRWSFTRPFTWLSGVAVNLVLSVLYLVVAPLTGRPHRDWAILVGSYFAVFILADVTTTNVLGADARRVRASLAEAVPLWRILLSKNLALLLVVGVPTLVATAMITLDTEAADDLLLTLPGVLFPVLTWFGVGNLISVLLPVPALPLRERWRRRRDLRATALWAVALALPYALCLVVDPTSELPIMIVRALRPSWDVGLALPATVLVVLGLAFYVVGSSLALAYVRVRRLRLDDATVRACRS